MKESKWEELRIYLNQERSILKLKEKVLTNLILRNQVQMMLILNNIIFIDVQFVYAEFLKELNPKIAVIPTAWIVS